MSLQVPGPKFKPPLPNRGPPERSNNVTLMPAPSTRGKVARGKVALAPGHSPLDWARLKTSADLRQVSSFMRITPSQLLAHRKKGDLWMALGGRVYNVTRYVDFHPGGVAQLMRAAGKDGTQLYSQIFFSLFLQDLM